ncbi:hypothetical protein A5883_003665, partial [Enterococcus sp. 5B3_DIV0040]
VLFFACLLLVTIMLGVKLIISKTIYIILQFMKNK